MLYQTSSLIGPCYSYLYLMSGACTSPKSRRLLFAWFLCSAGCTFQPDFPALIPLSHRPPLLLTTSLIFFKHLYHIDRSSLCYDHTVSSHFLNRLHLALQWFFYLDGSGSKYWYFVRYVCPPSWLFFLPSCFQPSRITRWSFFYNFICYQIEN